MYVRRDDNEALSQSDIKGISCYRKSLAENGQEIDKNVISFIENVLFTTLTNVNFDAKEHVELLRKSQEIKEDLRDMAGIMYDKSLDTDIRSLRQTILYGLKGISAYGHHATLSYAEKIVEAVKAGKIRHFFLIGGCDGARPGRNYYTEFAKMVPEDWKT